MLYSRAAHEPLRGAAWDARRARRGVDDIVDDALAARAKDGSWPAHPLDVRAGQGVYAGSAGVVYALRALGTDVLFDAAAELERTSAAGYVGGALGIALVSWWLEPSEAAAAVVEHTARELLAGGENELASGAAGVAVATSLLFDETHDERWAALGGEAVQALWGSWVFDREVRACVWTQQRQDGTRQFLGAAHGVAGNAHALLRWGSLQSAEHQRELLARVVETLERTAVRERGVANWPDRVDRPDRAPRVQWCHGAPGIVTALAHAPAQRELDDLLVAAGELTWQAGPLKKGSGLCHGTAGNGFAFLKLHARTKQAKWLDRARRFAMHALEQTEAAREEHGRGRYTFWTGDLGVALYLRACLDVDERWPLLDVL
jgi:Lanthionine synthetase C-like protein